MVRGQTPLQIAEEIVRRHGQKDVDLEITEEIQELLRNSGNVGEELSRLQAKVILHVKHLQGRERRRLPRS